MRALTSFQIHSTTIAQKRQDGLDFVKMGAIEDARRLASDLSRAEFIDFNALTTREITKLDLMAFTAAAEITIAADDFVSVP